MLYFFRVDRWHQAENILRRGMSKEKYTAFNGFVVRMDHPMYSKDFYFVLDCGNEWQ